MGLYMQTHKYDDITWIIFTIRAFHYNGHIYQDTMSKRLIHIFFPTCICMESVIKEKKCLYKSYQDDEIPVKRLTVIISSE